MSNQITINVSKNVENPTKHKTRREFGNRGYVKKMRKIPLCGIFCAVVFAFFMSSSVALLKIVPNLHPISVLVYRCIIQGAVFFIITIYNEKTSLLFKGISGERGSLAGRSITGMMNQLGWYTSIRYISLTDSSAIYYSAPVFVTVFAYFMLGEHFGIFEFTSVTITVIGVCLVSKPEFLPFFNNSQASNKLNENVIKFDLNNIFNLFISNQNNETDNYHAYGMSLAFFGAITFALSNIYVRKLKKTPTEITAFWFAIVTIITCTPLMFILNVVTLPETALEWTIIGLVGIFSVLGQIAFTLALKIERAGPVSICQTLNIVIVLIYQIGFFHESITITSLIGIFLIILSVIIIGLKDMINGTKLIKKTVKKLSKSYIDNLENNLNQKPSIEYINVEYIARTDIL